jgi:SNF2 family DNA or RNA helicase
MLFLRVTACTVVCKVSAVDLNNLASEEDVTDIVNLYHEYFEKDADEDEPPISGTSPDTPASMQQLNDCGGDFGMELEATMNPAALASSLGFKGGLPPLFNSLRHRSGISPWEDPKAFIDPTPKPLPEHLSKMALHWHQLAGVHSIVRSIFTQHPDAHHAHGVLVGDEVGLGKTAQGIAFIAFLIQAIWLQRSHRNPSPILGENHAHSPLFLSLTYLLFFLQRSDVTSENTTKFHRCRTSLFAPGRS